MNNFEIKYTKDGEWTSHSFDTTQELKRILNKLKGIQVTPMAEGMPRNMRMLCIEHNDACAK